MGRWRISNERVRRWNVVERRWVATPPDGVFVRGCVEQHDFFVFVCLFFGWESWWLRVGGGFPGGGCERRRCVWGLRCGR